MNRRSTPNGTTNVRGQTDVPPDKQVPIEFIRPEEVSIDFINAFAVQVGNYGEILITVGQAAGPILVAVNDAEKRREFAKIRSVKAKTVARLAFTQASFESFLNTILAAVQKDNELNPIEEEINGNDKSEE